jgi:hypothetical protein
MKYDSSADELHLILCAERGGSSYFRDYFEEARYTDHLETHRFGLVNLPARFNALEAYCRHGTLFIPRFGAFYNMLAGRHACPARPRICLAETYSLARKGNNVCSYQAFQEGQVLLAARIRIWQLGASGRMSVLTRARDYRIRTGLSDLTTFVKGTVFK